MWLGHAIAQDFICTSRDTASSEPSQKQSFHQLMNHAMTVMDQGMKQAPMVGDPDRDFAAMMIPHHQGAIDMAKAEVLYGKDPVLRRLAQEIVVTQQQEIVVMRRQLDQTLPHPRQNGEKP